MGKDLFNDRISRFSIRKLNEAYSVLVLEHLLWLVPLVKYLPMKQANQVQAGDVTSTTATVSDESSSQTAVAAQASNGSRKYFI